MYPTLRGDRELTPKQLYAAAYHQSLSRKVEITNSSLPLSGNMIQPERVLYQFETYRWLSVRKRTVLGAGQIG